MSEKNSATLKTPYTTQYVSHMVSSSLLELSMALMLRQERGRALLLRSCCQGEHLLPKSSKPWSKPAYRVLLPQAGTVPGPSIFRKVSRASQP